MTNPTPAKLRELADELDEQAYHTEIPRVSLDAAKELRAVAARLEATVTDAVARRVTDCLAIHGWDTGSDGDDLYDDVRAALLAALPLGNEPQARHWVQAVADWRVGNESIKDARTDTVRWIEARARELCEKDGGK